MSGTFATTGSGTTSGTPTHPFGAIEQITNAQRAAVNEWALVLAQDANGDDSYNNEKAMVGHLESAFHMLVDEDTDLDVAAARAIEVDLVALGKNGGIGDYLPGGKSRDAHIAAHAYLQVDATDLDARAFRVNKLSALNYVALREAGLTSASAFVCAALRARYIVTGAYGVTKADTSVKYNEVKVVKDTDEAYGGIVAATDLRSLFQEMRKYMKAYLAEYKSEAHGMKWVTLHAENIWAAGEHCFRVRNHHFKSDPKHADSYTDLYNRYLTAAYEDDFELPTGVTGLDVFRTAIHPFKLKALPVMTAHYVAHGKVANSGIIRMSGSPCGCASITTTVAALNTMKGEVWYTLFAKVYAEPIAMAMSFAEQINANKYSYHISAGLYGLAKKMTLDWKGKQISVDSARSQVEVIASACQGLINALKQAKTEGLISQFALQNAKALEKPAASNPLLSIRITFLVTNALNAVTNSEKVTDAINSALPMLESDKKSKSAKEDKEVD